MDNDYKKAMDFASKIQDGAITKKAIELKGHYLDGLSLEKLTGMLSDHPSDAQVAQAVCDKIVQMPFKLQDRELLENLVSVFELDKTKYSVDDQLKTVKKDRYHIAVMLPFMLEELKTNPRRVSNEFVLELYEGLLLGVSDLKSQGIDVKLHLYDTRRDSSYTAILAQLDELKHMDMIVGPLYPGPVQVITDFAFRNQINMINPLSNNSEIVANHPFAFLFNPSDEMAAKKLAAYTSNAVVNKNLMIFHGLTNRDSVTANAYKTEIESLGFKVNYMEGIDKDNGKKVLDILTNTRTIEIEESEVDQPLNQSNLQGNLRIGEMSFLTIKPDSIGHIFIASNEPSIIANAVTGLATRGDTIRIVGTEKWLEHRSISLEGLDRQRAILAAPTFFYKEKPKYESLLTLCKETFMTYPTKNFFIGYELMVTTGKLLKKHGTLFQYDPTYKQAIPGEISGGVLYGDENCNEIVPVATFTLGDIILQKNR
ncbi:MAG: ABC transporter substrate-binding protein [Cyclobacteriaceae bacterium]|nr:ABC transporter substrate-binding protein [Cyclobacteriaceae bacterium]